MPRFCVRGTLGSEWDARYRGALGRFNDVSVGQTQPARADEPTAVELDLAVPSLVPCRQNHKMLVGRWLLMLRQRVAGTQFVVLPRFRKEDVFEGWFEDAVAVQRILRLAGVEAEVAEMPLPSVPPEGDGRLAGSVWVSREDRVLARRIIAARRS